MRRSLIALLVGLGSTAHAGGEAWRIDLPAELGCPSPAALRHAVERELGHPLARAIAVTLEVAAGDHAAMSGRLTVGADVRVLAGASCAEVVGGAALIIALAAEAQPVPVTVGSPRQPRPDASTLEVREPSDGATGELRVELEAGAEVGPLPGAAAVVAGALGAAGSGWSLGLYGERFGHAVVAAGGGKVELALWDLGLRGCVRPGPLSACVTAVVGRMSGQGVGLSSARSGSAVVAGLDLAVRAEWPIGRRVGLYGETGLGLWSNRPRFALRDGTQAHEAELFWLSLRAGVWFELP